MKKKNKGLNIIFLIFLIILYFFFAFKNSSKTLWKINGKNQAYPSNTSQEDHYHLACPFSEAVYLGSKNDKPQNIKAAALILPHHLLAKDLIINTLKKIDQNYSTIVIIGPNHWELGSENIQTSYLNWQTKFGTLESDRRLITALALENLVEIKEDNFNTEHTVCGLVSFVKIYFPKTKIIPIILKSSTSQKETTKLAQFLSRYCIDCLIIGSLDFSHEVSLDQAQINDKLSIDVLKEVNEKMINEVTCDSLPTLKLMFSYLNEKKINQGELIENSNSYLINQENPQSVTSYITIIY